MGVVAPRSPSWVRKAARGGEISAVPLLTADSPLFPAEFQQGAASPFLLLEVN